MNFSNHAKVSALSAMTLNTDTKEIISPVNAEKRREIDIQAGDTVRVMVKIPEGDGDYRLQPFEGIVLARKHGSEAGATFTVRQIIDGVGVEKIFPLYSPRIDEITILRRSKTRRSKLYHIRDKAARQIRRQMRKMVQVDISTGSEAEAESTEDDEAPTISEDEGVEKQEAETSDEDPESSSNDNDRTSEEESESSESDDKVGSDELAGSNEVEEAESPEGDEVPSEEQSGDSGENENN